MLFSLIVLTVPVKLFTLYPNASKYLFSHLRTLWSWFKTGLFIDFWRTKVQVFISNLNKQISGNRLPKMES